jgi:hypothetical protein
LAIVTLRAPPKVSVWIGPTAAPLPRTATVTWPKVMSRSPKLFDSFTRNAVPPVCRWTISRRVWLV